MGGFSYPDQVMYETEPTMEMFDGIIGFFAIIYFAMLFMALAFSAVTYVLHSWSLYTIAKRRGIRNGYLAWIPVGNLWILGNVSDQYQYVVKRKIKNRRKKLVRLSIGLCAGYFLWLLVTLTNLKIGREAAALFLLVFGGLIILAAAIWLAVCQYLSYYDLYKSCEPDNAALYLVLSIVFPVVLPFFVFICRNRDLGMPPRKKAPAEAVVEPAEIIIEKEDVIAEPMEEGFASDEEFEDE